MSKCDERAEVSFTSPGTRTLMPADFANPSSPLDVDASSLQREELLISGLEEFVGYLFNVTPGETQATQNIQTR